jgi:hypothetical protein
MQKSWDGYIVGLNAMKTPSSNIDTLPFPTSGGPSSGFLEFHPKSNQKKYDAMNPEWEGIKASNSAINLFKADFMPVKNEFS